MRLIQLTDEQAVWLHGVMQNPLSDEPTLADERLRGEIFEAVTLGAVSTMPVGTRVEVTANVPAAIRSIKAAMGLVEETQNLEDCGVQAWDQLETVDDRLHDALTALGE